MLKSKRLAFIALALLCCASLLSLPAATRNPPPVFSSVYTDLNKDCRAALKSVGEGQDMPLRCKGYGGYSIYISYSAWASDIYAEPAGRKSKESDDLIHLAMQQLNYDQEKGRKIEWRMADGKPFAVIMRITKLKDNAGADGDNPWDPKYKAGEALIVKGLKGQNIDFEVDVKSTPNPNEKARQLADSNYK